MDLCVIVLTSNMEKETKPPKIMPKVCFKIGEKTMLEICLENVIRLNPSRIILMVSKNEIIQINRVIKYATYQKLISYCIYDRERNISESKISETSLQNKLNTSGSKANLISSQKLSNSQTCYEGKNILVIPANSPLLTTKSMNKMISENRNVKINNSLFYLKKDSVHKIDTISEYSSKDEKFLSSNEILQVETRGQYEDVINIFKSNENKK